MNCEPSQGIKWECETDSGFIRYNETDAYNLEKAHLEGSAQPVSVRSDQNEVDIQHMKQKNKSTGVQRNVRRHDLSALMVSQTRAVELRCRRVLINRAQKVPVLRIDPI